MYCPHGTAAYIRCPKCEEQARRERIENAFVERLEEVSTTLKEVAAAMARIRPEGTVR